MYICILILITAQLSLPVTVGQGGTRRTRKRLENWKPGGKTARNTTPGDRLDTLLAAGHGVPLAIRTARRPVTTDNLLTNSATVSDESPQESCHKKSEKPLVLAILGSLPSAGLRKVEYGRTAGNLTICRPILPQSAMSPHKNEEPPSHQSAHFAQPVSRPTTQTKRLGRTQNAVWS